MSYPFSQESWFTSKERGRIILPLMRKLLTLPTNHVATYRTSAMHTSPLFMKSWKHRPFPFPSFCLFFFKTPPKTGAYFPWWSGNSWALSEAPPPRLLTCFCLCFMRPIVKLQCWTCLRSWTIIQKAWLSPSLFYFSFLSGPLKLSYVSFPSTRVKLSSNFLLGLFLNSFTNKSKNPKEAASIFLEIKPHKRISGWASMKQSWILLRMKERWG